MTPFAYPIPYQSPHAYFAKVADKPHALLLDACAGAAGARYAYIACAPWQVIRTEGDNPLARLDAISAPYQLDTVQGLPPFQTGMAGYLAYEVGRHIERLPAPKPTDQPMPEAVFGCYDVIAAFDTLTQQAWIISSGFPHHGQARARHAYERYQHLWQWLQAEAPAAKPVPHLAIQPTHPPTAFKNAVARTRAYILAGDIFQANIALRLEANWPSDACPWAAYQALCAANPAPYAAFMRLEKGAILSQSPEHFLTVADGHVTTRPIKGTLARRGHDAAERSTLLASTKDKAENLMIVDLLRNDLARVCVAGSVRVPQLWQVETHPFVHHLVSTITGRLQPNTTAIDVLRACLAGGSITGAPKIRAQEIIHELEPLPRGVYCGTMGYIGFDGRLEMNLAIRTAVQAQGKITWCAGCGIVADSTPDAEYAEAMAKAASFITILGKRTDVRVA